MANLKNITDLPMAESAEGINLIVNDNGSAKQIAASAVGGAQGVQADWSIEDESNPAFIKNRTHWAKVVFEEVLPLTTFQAEDYDEYWYGFVVNDIELISGCEYVISWNGKEYTCISSTVLKYGIERIVLGNIDWFLGSGDNGLPFILTSAQGTSGDCVVIKALDESVPTITISGTFEKIHKLDNKYLNIINSNIENGSVTGSIRTIYSTKEDENYKIGDFAFAEGHNTKASGQFSHAEGRDTTASGSNSHAEGNYTTAAGAYSHAEGSFSVASGDRSHAEGDSTTASNRYSHAEGGYSVASGESSHAEGNNTTASGNSSHAEGRGTTASGYSSHAEGYGTIASGKDQHVQGRYNKYTPFVEQVEGTRGLSIYLPTDIIMASNNYSFNDVTGEYELSGAEKISIDNISNYTYIQLSSKKIIYSNVSITSQRSDYASGTGTLHSSIESENDYAHIVGNGTYDSRSNAHTLDWDGNAWFAGNIEGTAMIISSQNGTRFAIKVSDDGTLSAEAVQ